MVEKKPVLIIELRSISDDDENSKKVISGLISDVGFDAVDAGALSESWRHQPGTPRQLIVQN